MWPLRGQSLRGALQVNASVMPTHRPGVIRRRGVLACFALGVLTTCAAPPKLYEGKSRSEWVSLLKSTDHVTRVDAASALGSHFGPDAAPDILPLLFHEQAGTRSMAAFALSMCGNDSKEIIEGLERLLVDGDEIVRIDAALAISRLECPKGRAARVLPQLIAGIPNPQRTLSVARWLQKLGPKAAPAIPALVKTLASDDVDTRLNVPMTLACIGADAAVALPRLREIQTGDADSAVRENSEKAIQAIESAVAGPTGEPSWCK